MARKPQFTDERILAAGERLAATGVEVNKTALRRAVGGGNPARLWDVWQRRGKPPRAAARPPSAGAQPAAGRETKHPPAAPPPAREPRKRDPERTRRDILEAAIAEFADKGLSGARVDAIAARTRTTKRSIYYYFGSKDGLYIAVLETVYASIRSVERTFCLTSLDPVEAMRKLIGFTFDYHNDHPDFSRLVVVENIHHARHLKRSASIRNLNVSVIDDLREVLRHGRRTGQFTRDIDPVDLHMMISAFCFFRMSNRYTFSAIFDWDLTSAEAMAKHKTIIADMILSYLSNPDAPAPLP